MSFGRIKRSRAKIAKAHHGSKKGPTIRTWLGRGGKGVYSAYACISFGKSTSKPVRHDRCSKGLSHGRTPQAAIAKALKSLSGVIATRGRKR